MPRRRVTATVVANGELVYTIEDRPKPGAPPAACSVIIVLGADEHHPQPPEAEPTPADPD